MAHEASDHDNLPRMGMPLPNGKLAIWLFLVTEITFFTAMIGTYMLIRNGQPTASNPWPAPHDVHLVEWIGAFNTFVLLTSSLSAVLAHQAAEKGDGRKAGRLLFATIGGGLVFLIVKSFEWTHEIREGFTITSSGFWSYYYTAAGLHAFHVIAGMIIMGFVAVAAMKNENLHRVENVGIYWHFVDIVWIFLFPLLYIAK